MKRLRRALEALVTASVISASSFSLPSTTYAYDANLIQSNIQQNAQQTSQGDTPKDSQDPKKTPQSDYVEMGKPVTFKRRGKKTVTSKFYLDSEVKNIETGLDQETFYSRLKPLSKRLEIEAVLDLSNLAQKLGRHPGRYLNNQDLIKDFLKISKGFEKNEDYSQADTKNIKDLFSTEDNILKVYPKGSILTITYNNNSISFESYNIKTKQKTKKVVNNNQQVTSFGKWLNQRIEQKNKNIHDKGYLSHWFKGYEKGKK